MDDTQKADARKKGFRYEAIGYKDGMMAGHISDPDGAVPYDEALDAVWRTAIRWLKEGFQVEFDGEKAHAWDKKNQIKWEAVVHEL